MTIAAVVGIAVTVYVVADDDVVAVTAVDDLLPVLLSSMLILMLQ